MNCKTLNSARLSFVVIAVALVMFGAYKLTNNQTAQNKISNDEALSRINAKEVKEVTLKDRDARFAFKSGGEVVVADLSEIQKEDILKVIDNYNSENYKNPITLNFAAASNPMDRIFQIIFILFFISPPLIVLLLFLIWRELQKRNEK